MRRDFGSIVTAAVTPFDATGRVDLGAFRNLLRHLVSNGSNSIVVCGTTGEGPTLSDDEKVELWRTAVEEVGATTPIIAGSSSGNDTAKGIELTRRAVETGVDGILAVTPYYNKPPREGLLRHFAEIAGAAGDLPVIIYNIPARVVLNLDPSLLAELATIDNVVAVKQANPDLVECQELVSLAPDLAIYAGNDDSLLPMLALGAVGGITVASHIVGPQMARVCELWREGDEAGARALGETLEDVYETLNVTANPIPVKAALNLIGVEVGAPRLPLVEATGMQVAKIRSMLERHDLVAAHA